MIVKSVQLIGMAEAIEQSLSTKQPVVVLVPGWKDHHQTMTPLAKHLKNAGLPVVTISPQPSDGSIRLEVMAQEIKPVCDRIFEATQLPIKLVGFSMGGLITRSYVQELNGVAKCSHLVTIATPHLGTLNAFVSDLPGIVQMRPNNPWLHHLNNTLGEIIARTQTNAVPASDNTSPVANLEPLRLTSIWSPLDTTIVPPNSSFLPQAENIKILSPIHALLMKDRRVHHAVAEALRG